MNNTEPTHDDLPYIYACHRIHGIGTEALSILSKNFDRFHDVWHASQGDLAKSGLSKKQVESILTQRESTDVEKLYQDSIVANDIHIIARESSDYPTQLHDLENPPFALYARGAIDLLHETSIAIVGSRKISTYGTQCTERLAIDLATQGIHIVSGLALGIDAAAHQSITSANLIGKPIAVLGGGIDDASIAPRSHVSLAQKIIKRGGVIISEYQPGTTPSKGTFPARNRIMAALSAGTLVIEAAHDSGTLITARDARDLRRHVFAVPGSIFAPQSVGTNHLIACGHAQIVQDVRTITATCATSMKSSPTPEKTLPAMDENTHTLYTLLRDHPDGLSIDHLSRASDLSGGDVSSTLVMMEIDGMIKKTHGGIYVII